MNIKILVNVSELPENNERIEDIRYCLPAKFEDWDDIDIDIWASHYQFVKNFADQMLKKANELVNQE